MCVIEVRNQASATMERCRLASGSEAASEANCKRTGQQVKQKDSKEDETRFLSSEYQSDRSSALQLEDPLRCNATKFLRGDRIAGAGPRA